MISQRPPIAPTPTRSIIGAPTNLYRRSESPPYAAPAEGYDDSDRDKGTVALKELLQGLGSSIPAHWGPVDKPKFDHLGRERKQDDFDKRVWDEEGDGFCVFIYGLPYGCTRDDLWDLNDDLKLDAMDMRVAENDQTRPLGIGLGLFRTEEAAQAALVALEGYTTCNRVLSASRQFQWPIRYDAAKLVRFWGPGGFDNDNNFDDVHPARGYSPLIREKPSPPPLPARTPTPPVWPRRADTPMRSLEEMTRTKGNGSVQVKMQEEKEGKEDEGQQRKREKEEAKAKDLGDGMNFAMSMTAAPAPVPSRPSSGAEKRLWSRRSDTPVRSRGDMWRMQSDEGVKEKERENVKERQEEVEDRKNVSAAPTASVAAPVPARPSSGAGKVAWPRRTGTPVMSLDEMTRMKAGV
ncbi:hypothetical protein HDV00_003495 [Rhizophlyctis rosea]|nr:hypothetical protein HDV00_003495 [Rhizophlyctis rosea]